MLHIRHADAQKVTMNEEERDCGCVTVLLAQFWRVEEAVVAAVVLPELVGRVAAAPLSTSGGAKLSDLWC